MKKSFTFLLAVFGCLTVSAQSISGNVVDDNEQALEFANVLLMSAADSSMLLAELTDVDGSFSFKKVPAGKYYLDVNTLGFSDYFSEVFELGESDLPVPTIKMSTSGTQLEEFTLTARKPFLEQRAGRLVVNVENSIAGANGSLQDLLKRVPGLVVVNNQSQMAGKPSVTIFIDGKPTQYLDIQSLLRDMPADNIARIEVISQPDASYEAAGTGGIINIVLKKNLSLGTNGSVRLGVNSGRYWGYNGSVGVNRREGKWNLFGGAGYSHNAGFEGMELVRRTGTLTFRQDNHAPWQPNTYRVNGGADYQIDDRHSVGLSGRYVWSDNDRRETNTTLVTEGDDLNGPLLQEFFTFTDKTRDYTFYSLDGHYTFEIDTAGQKLLLTGSMSQYDRSVTNLLTTQLLRGEPLDFTSTRDDTPTLVDIRALKLDYTLPLGKKTELKAGGKLSFVEVDSDLQAEIIENGEWQNNPNITNHFVFDEDIRALYLNVNHKTEKFDLAAGLRYESTQSVGNSITLDSVNRRDYERLFPSISVDVPVGKVLGVSAAYSYRIDRPNYGSLNPFINFVDPYTFQRGNPFLQPQFTHSTNLSLTYERQPFFNLEHNVTQDVMVFVTEQDNATGIAFAQDINLDEFAQTGGSLFFPLDWIGNGITGYGGGMLYWNRYNSEYLGDQFEEDVWSFTGFLQVNAKLGERWKAEATGWYQGGGLDGIIRFRPMYGVSFGLETELLDERATLSLSANQLFFQYFRGKVDYQDQQIDILSQWQVQTVGARFTYRFGNQFLKEKKRVEGANRDEMNRAN